MNETESCQRAGFLNLSRRLSTNFENFRTFAQLLKSPMMEYLQSLQLVSFITYSCVTVWKTQRKKWLYNLSNIEYLTLYLCLRYCENNCHDYFKVSVIITILIVKFVKNSFANTLENFDKAWWISCKIFTDK